MTARIGKQHNFSDGTAIPLTIDGRAIVCESMLGIDRSMPADVARTKGQALIVAADEADQMAADQDRS